MAGSARFAEERDLQSLTRIYNHYVTQTAITFDVEPVTPKQRQRWLEGFSAAGRHRCLVAELDGEVCGYACSGHFRAKAAYDTTVEVSVYLDPEATGQGLGGLLYRELFASLRETDLHRAIGIITLPNAASIALHRRFGFESIGVLHEVGRKFDRYWDVEWFEKDLTALPTPG
jgi:phosphinothricin acetyltransferase